MKKIVLAAITAATLASAPAFAADMSMPVKARPMPPPAYSWTGCYLGAGGGYGLYSQDHYTLTGGVPTSVSDTSGGRGWYGTAGGGCDYQFSMGNLGNWVVGAFGDYDFMNIHGNFETATFAFTGPEKESSAWAAGGRIGYLVTPSVLTFFSAGFTESHFNAINFPTVTTYFPSHNYNGWFLGGGTETSLSPWLPIGWFLKSDYRYSTYQGVTLPVLFPGGAPTPFSEHMNKYVQTIGTELVYRFNFH